MNQAYCATKGFPEHYFQFSSSLSFPVMEAIKKPKYEYSTSPSLDILGHFLRSRILRNNLCVPPQECNFIWNWPVCQPFRRSNPSNRTAQPSLNRRLGGSEQSPLKQPWGAPCALGGLSTAGTAPPPPLMCRSPGGPQGTETFFFIVLRTCLFSRQVCLGPIWGFGPNPPTQGIDFF